MVSIIGITGFKGSGKSTLASMLAEMIPDAEIVAFADALRYEVIDMLNAVVVDCQPSDAWSGIGPHRSWLEERKATIFGPLLQGHGEFRRQWNGEDYWIEEFAEYIRHSKNIVIAPDVRYPNEANYIKGKGGLLVAIHGPSRWEGDARDANHPSETSVAECQTMATYKVVNDGSLDDLRRQAGDIVKWVLTHVGN